MAKSLNDVVIVGGGVIGCAIGYGLTKHGVGVTIIDSGPIGNEASWASAGIISIPNRMDMAPERIEITRRGHQLYPALVAEVEHATGISTSFRQLGDVYLAVDEEHARHVDRLSEWQRGLGFDMQKLDTATARELDPALPEEIASVWYSPDVSAISLHRFTQALAAAAAQNGATVLAQTPVMAVNQDAGRVTGIKLASGDIAADTVILATGSWTRFFSDALSVPLDILPIKGQLIAFANPPVRPSHVISGHGGYVLPRPDGTTLAAATEEDAGFDRRVTGDGLTWLLNLAQTLCPSLVKGEVAETWTGLRPGTQRGEPYMGPVPGYEGLWVAAGHFRTGAKEAPGSAELIVESLVSGTVDERLTPFLPPSAEVSRV